MPASPFDTDYTYDFPVPSTSYLSNEPSPSRIKLKRHRSISPSASNSRLIHMPHYQSTKYHPSSRASDISRLLDPSYASNSHSASTSADSNPTSVYVDNHGDLHDPDYRHFPPMGHSMLAAKRPRWEIGEAEDNDEASEDEETTAENTFGSSSRTTSTRRRSRTPNSLRPSYGYSSSYYYDVHTEPSSFESTVLHEEDEDETSPFSDTREEKKERCRLLYRTRSNKRTEEAVEEKPLNAQSATEEYVPSKELEAEEWTPTCTQSLHRQWQAFTLCIRFSIFRTQRRLRRRVGRG